MGLKTFQVSLMWFRGDFSDDLFPGELGRISPMHWGEGPVAFKKSLAFRPPELRREFLTLRVYGMSINEKMKLWK